jgi:hypothetical protein
VHYESHYFDYRVSGSWGYFVGSKHIYSHASKHQEHPEYRGRNSSYSLAAFSVRYPWEYQHYSCREVVMEMIIYALIAVGFAAIGFVIGILVGRNNANDVEKVVTNLQDDAVKAQKVADIAKAKLEAAGKLLIAKVS